MAFTEQLGRKWSLLIGSAGQAFAMFYIGINQAVHPPTGELDGNAIFAIMCVYLFVVFYSFGWGPIPFVLSSECAPNHVRSLIMAAALMTQWLFNFVIAVSPDQQQACYALSNRLPETHAHHVGGYYIRHLPLVRVRMHHHGYLHHLLCP
jgi:hypothetical protein